MCGIAGFVDRSLRCGRAELEATASQMVEKLRHRGPDDGGAWADPRFGIALSHRRLAILDLSAEGHQPMHSRDGRFVLVFNGEIYNFKSLRAELESFYAFRSQSDSEVMLAAFSRWGVEKALKRFVGMFAFALWDRDEEQLHLARDRMGEKPLYYGSAGGVFVFASELKALRAHPDWRGEVNRKAVALFMRHSYIPAPLSIYEGVFKLPPGCWLTLDASNVGGKIPTPIPYWSLRETVESGLAHPFRGTEEEAVEELTRRLREAVAQQMIADVPLGAFLSGGIDSSTVVALMQEQSARPIRTFSIGFHEKKFNEAPHAKEVAHHLGTEHTELYVTPKELRGVIPRLPEIYDEPFADDSQIPTTILCELTRRHVKVSLSGDGGDELFGGYLRYFQTTRIWPLIQRIPPKLQGVFARSLASATSGVKRISPESIGRLLNRALNFADMLPAASVAGFYHALASPCRKPEEWLSDNDRAIKLDGLKWSEADLLQRMTSTDAAVYLPDDILVKVDRAAMSTSLETRVPLLDHRIVEFAWALPKEFKCTGGKGKRVLRKVLNRYVPAELVERPKQGFAIPIEDWLRGPLRHWAEPLLDEGRLRREGFFKSKVVRQKWNEHLEGRRNWGASLWNVLVFQAWLDSQKPSIPSGFDRTERPAAILAESSFVS